MNVPAGFLGTEADLFMDLLVTVVPAILLVMGLGWRWARKRSYTRHRNLMVTLAAVLLVAVGALETHLALQGGVEGIGIDVDRAGWILNIHLGFSSFTSIVWIALIAASVWKFPRPPAPNSFSRFHRFWGRAGMIGMAGTAITAVIFYVVAFG